MFRKIRGTFLRVLHWDFPIWGSYNLSLGVLGLGLRFSSLRYGVQGVARSQLKIEGVEKCGAIMVFWLLGVGPVFMRSTMYWGSIILKLKKEFERCPNMEPH